MPLALFDLDNTLIAGDSDYLWGRFLATQGVVDSASYERENHRYYEAYKAGTLDIHAFLAFAFRPLAAHPLPDLLRWRAAYIQHSIRPLLLPAAQALVDEHRRAGRRPVVITATNRFVTEPIAALYGVPDLIATEPEFAGGAFTGRVAGIPCFREGKVARLQDWLRGSGESLDGSWFYSDSHNDLPLLEAVTHPVAVDPDPALLAAAQAHGWPVISLRPPSG